MIIQSEYQAEFEVACMSVWPNVDKSKWYVCIQTKQRLDLNHGTFMYLYPNL